GALPPRACGCSSEMTVPGACTNAEVGTVPWAPPRNGPSWACSRCATRSTCGDDGIVADCLGRLASAGGRHRSERAGQGGQVGVNRAGIDVDTTAAEPGADVEDVVVQEVEGVQVRSEVDRLREVDEPHLAPPPQKVVGRQI